MLRDARNEAKQTMQTENETNHLKKQITDIETNCTKKILFGNQKSEAIITKENNIP